MPVSYPTRDNQPELPDGFDTAEVNAVLEGAVDLHVHPFPSPFPRRMGILEAAQDAEKAKYRAIVMKSHHHSTVTDVLALDEVGINDLNVKVFGGIALNPPVGGLNPYAVDLTLNMGGKIVWFPTLSSPAHLEHEEEGHTGNFPTATIGLRHAYPISILDETGKIKAEAMDILEQIKAHGAIVTGGHLPAREIDVLITEAQRIGLERIIVNHPNFIVGASLDVVREWARKGVFIEHAVVMYGDFFGHRKANIIDLDVLESYMEAAGVGQTLLVSDSGQKGAGRPVDVVKVAIKNLLGRGYEADAIRTMVGDNAASLLLG